MTPHQLTEERELGLLDWGAWEPTIPKSITAILSDEDFKMFIGGVDKSTSNVLM